MSGEKAFLFLQGPSSPLFSKIAENLTRAGHACYRINLNVGDQIFWRRGGAFHYRGGLERWGAYVQSFMEERDIGTIILLGEERPYHKEAVRVAKERGVEVVVIEMGYLRPDWVVVELDGMSSNSLFPNDPDVILSAGADLPEPDWTRKHSQTFLAEALYDLAYYLPSIFFGFLYPRYRFHGIFHPLTEYIGWIGRLATRKSRARSAHRLTENLYSGNATWFVYPLQLETDYQLRAHSPYNSQRDAIIEVIKSFAKFSEKSTKLLIKVHPLDNGLISWKKVTETRARREGVADRVVYLGGGDLNLLVKGSQGIVTVNSTSALQGLKEGIPTKVLGSAVYDVAGVTDQKKLDEFWSAPHRPDPDTTTALIKLLAFTVHVRGNFYSKSGSAAAARAISRRLSDGHVNRCVCD